MKNLRALIVGVVATAATLSAVVTFGQGPYPCGVAGDCKGKASVKFYSEATKVCYSLKASCKGDFVGAEWSVGIVGPNGSTVDVGTTPGATPACSAQGIDPAGVRKVKTDCDTDSVGDCGEQSTAKASVKRSDDLCAPCCEKPDKATGSCDGVCPPDVCGNEICEPSEDRDNCPSDCKPGLCQPCDGPAGTPSNCDPNAPGVTGGGLGCYPCVPTVPGGCDAASPLLCSDNVSFVDCLPGTLY